MKRLFLTGAITCLLVVMVSIAWAVTNLNSSRSNNYRLTYDPTAVTPAQATAILKDLDTIGQVDETKVRKLLQKHGVKPGLIQKIRIVPAGQRREKIPAVLLLTSSADEPAAIAVTDEGVGPAKPTKSTK